jgi:hypothetical protein
MNLDTPTHQLFWSLLIGGEIFAVAALWPLSDWASARPRGAWFALALGVAFACIALDLHALGAGGLFDTSRWPGLDTVIRWLVLPMTLAFPDAVCVASAQSLRRAGAAGKLARAISLAVAALAVVVAPFAAVGAGCGLDGMCS